MTNKPSVHWRIKILILLVSLLLLRAVWVATFHFAQTASPGSENLSPFVPVMHYQILRTLPHAKQAFTEGLSVDQEKLYESTGVYGDSKILVYRLSDGHLLQSALLSNQYFGEGLTVWGPWIYQLTYQSHTGFVYDKETLALKRTFYCPTQGWGLTHDDHFLIVSDGSAKLYFLDPLTFHCIKTITVTANNRPIERLNALTFANHRIYANVWHTHGIAQIDPDTGKVTAWLDLRQLMPREEEGETNVLNGIAYISGTQTFLITGKYWPNLYELRFS